MILEQKANEEGADTVPLWFSNWASCFASDVSDFEGSHYRDINCCESN